LVGKGTLQATWTGDSSTIAATGSANVPCATLPIQYRAWVFRASIWPLVCDVVVGLDIFKRYIALDAACGKIGWVKWRKFAQAALSFNAIACRANCCLQISAQGTALWTCRGIEIIAWIANHRAKA